MDKRQSINRAAIDTLNKIDPKFIKTVPACIKAATDDQREVRHTASEALQVLTQLDPQWARSQMARNTIPYLVTTLANSNSEVRQMAVDLLTKIDPQWMRNHDLPDLKIFRPQI